MLLLLDRRRRLRQLPQALVVLCRRELALVLQLLIDLFDGLVEVGGAGVEELLLLPFRLLVVVRPEVLEVQSYCLQTF